GDLKGNVWKFDLTDDTPGKWSIALGKKPLFTAKDASGKVQPITAQIGLSVNDVKTDPNHGKLFVFFGTGSYLDKADPSNKSVQ
ncbi:PilC/PilY family type IV pilus protein, partial [Escherichia coli]|nr:PilC/PilY family type IV pilus protein [Escherichia coli]